MAVSFLKPLQTLLVRHNIHIFALLFLKKKKNLITFTILNFISSLDIIVQTDFWVGLLSHTTESQESA